MIPRPSPPAFVGKLTPGMVVEPSPAAGRFLPIRPLFDDTPGAGHLRYSQLFVGSFGHIAALSIGGSVLRLRRPTCAPLHCVCKAHRLAHPIAAVRPLKLLCRGASALSPRRLSIHPAVLRSMGPTEELDTASAAVHGHMLHTRICRFNEAGKCKYGSGCTFAHTADQLRLLFSAEPLSFSLAFSEALP